MVSNLGLWTKLVSRGRQGEHNAQGLLPLILVQQIVGDLDGLLGQVTVKDARHKALYQQPVGIDALGEQESPLEIEIVDPEEVTIGMDGVEITITPGEDDGEEGFSDNLAEYIKDGALQSLAGDLVSDIDNDKNGRKDWEKTYVDGLKLLGLQIEERSFTEDSGWPSDIKTSTQVWRAE